MIDNNIKSGARNLLITCAELKKKDNLLVIIESQKLGWYKKSISDIIVHEAESMGVKTKTLMVGAPKNNTKNQLSELIDSYDCTIFFARLGDQDRFETQAFTKKRIMSYARSSESLGSSYGRINYQATVKLKDEINKVFIDSKEIIIECPLGTKLTGNMLFKFPKVSNEVTVKRFPMVVPMPISASTFSGKVVIANYLTSTGSKVYEPASLKLKKPVIAYLDNGKIEKFEGDTEDVENVNKHYDNVSNMFTLDKNIVHSWHAGMHPGVTYDSSINENPDRWSNTIFSSPRFLHFHTCGNYAPGEICWMIECPLIRIDGVSLWADGKLKLQNFKTTAQVIQNWPELEEIYSD
jgi:hypothetical protein